MTLTEFPLSECTPWGLQEGGNFFGQPLKQFFHLGGFYISASGREVDGWFQPLLVENGEGAVVLIVHDMGKKGIRFLLQAKREPGNPTGGHILLAPTIQCSLSNLRADHGGKKPPRVELLPGGDDVEWQGQYMDGGRFNGKRNQYAVLLLNDQEISKVGDNLPNERWFTADEIEEALQAGEVNIHLARVMLQAALANK